MTDRIPDHLIILDTETTGLPHHHKARVIELGAVAVGPSGIFAEHFQSMVWPETFDPEQARGALMVSGITVEEFRTAPKPWTVAESFEAWRLRVCGGLWPLFAWNGHFDHGMLQRSGFALDVFDIAPECRRRITTWKSKGTGLAHAAKALDLAQDSAHRALPDALLAAKVWCALRHLP